MTNTAATPEELVRAAERRVARRGVESRCTQCGASFRDETPMRLCDHCYDVNAEHEARLAWLEEGLARLGLEA
jgi:Zn finger protein HypA/HybF involved in hydrogenase expression